MEDNNKHLIIAGIGIIVVIALAIALPHFKKPVMAPTTDTAATTASDTSAAKKPAVSATASADWNATLQKYANSSITFAADCTASPITQAHPLGSKVMLVNNSDVAHTITVGTTTYAVGAYHYKTAYLTAPGTVIVNCDAHPNVANVGVQQ